MCLLLTQTAIIDVTIAVCVVLHNLINYRMKFQYYTDLPESEQFPVT